MPGVWTSIGGAEGLAGPPGTRGRSPVKFMSRVAQPLRGGITEVGQNVTSGPGKNPHNHNREWRLWPATPPGEQEPMMFSG